MDSWQTCFNAYKISQTQELPGASPPGPHQGFALDPLGASSGPQPHAPLTWNPGSALDMTITTLPVIQQSTWRPCSTFQQLIPAQRLSYKKRGLIVNRFSVPGSRYAEDMKWLIYQRVISLETQVGITSQRNKWANTDPRIYRRWDHVPRRSKHPLWTGHTRRKPSSMIMNAELSAVKVSMQSTV
jgi:hypothetical protein